MAIGAELRRAPGRFPPGDGRIAGSGHPARRARRDLGSQPLRVAGRCARHPRSGCGPGPREYAVQARRGEPHPGAQWRAHGLHRGRVPGHGLQRDAVRTPPGARTSRPRHRLRPRLGRRSLARVLPAAGRVGERRRRRCANTRDTRRRHRRRDVHVGYDRRAQGCADDACAEPPPAPRLVRAGCPGGGRPLPDHQSLLPHVRLQGGLSDLPQERRDDHPEGGARPR